MNELHSSRGFTLVELLVAMALLSLVMLGLVTAMRSFAQTETRIDDRIRRDEDFRVTEQFLRTVLGAMAPRATRSAPGGPRQVAFSGSGDELQWIGVMPARHGAGGLYRFRLFVAPGESGQPGALVLEFAPLTNFDAPLESGPGQSRVMVAAVTDVTFRYQDSTQGDAAWSSGWPSADRLPRRIGVQARTRTGIWPEIVVNVIPAVGPGIPSRTGSGSGPVIGPF